MPNANKATAHVGVVKLKQKRESGLMFERIVGELIIRQELEVLTECCR